MQEYVEASEAKALPMVEYCISMQEHTVEYGIGRHCYSPREVLHFDVAWCHLRMFPIGSTNSSQRTSVLNLAGLTSSSIDTEKEECAFLIPLLFLSDER